MLFLLNSLIRRVAVVSRSSHFHWHSFREKRDRILGIHMVGENATEMVQSVAIALHQHTTRQVLMQTIDIHPSSAEELFSL